MIKLKQFWNKFRIWIGLFAAGVALSFLVLRKYVGDGLEQQREQFKKEEEAKLVSKQKLQEETKILEEKKQEEVKIVDEQKKQKLKEAVIKAKEEKRKLEEEAKRDPQGFKIQVDKELNIKEKKKKGRRK
jgi:colicin import membrane protein